MDSRNEKAPILKLLASGMRSLAHSIRGDLSVLTNDLTYLATVAPPGETDRLKARCQSIASALHGMGLFGSGVVTPKSVTLDELCRDCGVVLATGPRPELSVTVDATLFCRALGAVLSVLSTLLKSGTSWGAEGQVFDTETWTLTFLGELATEEADGFWSLGSFAGARLGERVIPQIAFGELALLCQGVTTTVRVFSRNSIAIETVVREVEK